MKKVIILGGPYGVGKTTLANNLVNALNNTVMFDGEWAWFQGNNWNFSPENKKMALNNICYMLNSFLYNPLFENIIFSWVMHKQEDHEIIINSLKNSGIEFELFNISLIANPETIQQRLENRISSKATEYNAFYDRDAIRKAVNGSLNKLNEIMKLDTIKVDVSDKNQEEVLTEVLRILNLEKDHDSVYIKH